MKIESSIQDAIAKLTPPHPVVRLYSYRPVSGLMSSFLAKLPSHTYVQWLFNLTSIH